MITKSISLFGVELFRVERDRNGQFSYTYLDNGNSYVDNGKYLDLYLTNPVLSTVVNFASQYYSQMKISHITNDGNEIKNSPYLKLLNTPNYFQSKEDFFYQQMVFLLVSGNDYIYQIKAFKNDVPKDIYNLIPSQVDFNDTNKLNRFLFKKSDKDNYGKNIIKYTLDNKVYNLLIDDIIPTYDLSNGLSVNSFMQSPSRVKPIAKILHNINENVNSKSVNLKMSQKYVGLNNNDGNKAQIQEGDKNSIEKAISNKNLLLTNAGIDFKHLVSDMKRLYLDEQYAEDFNKVLLAFGMNKNVINPFSKDSTFENQSQGIISYIQNQLQNTADNTMNSLSQSWGLFERNEKLVASYDHLPVMQSVINEKINTLKAFQETMKLGIENGTIQLSDATKMTNNLMLKLNL
jgi:phage portal protein BeeE